MKTNLKILCKNSFTEESFDALLANNDARKFLRTVPDNTIDYVITDPPHADEIQYLELSFLANSWLLGKNAYNLFQYEIVLNNKQGKNFQTYIEMLRATYEEINRVLRKNGYLIVFYHEEKENWLNYMIKAIIESN